MICWALIYCLFVWIVEGERDGYTNGNYSQNIPESSGHRLVGASRGTTARTPFLVAWNLDGSKHILCTGSLILPRWVVSAGHCIVKLVKLKRLHNCVEKSEYGVYSSGNRDVKCTNINGSFKIDLLKSKGAAYLKVDDVNTVVDVSLGYKIPVDFVVQHKYTYRGGTYGSFGGYDIALVHLAEPAPADCIPACLPSMHFKDCSLGPYYAKTDAEKETYLSGFGRYFRESCITDKFGKAKYHYCEEGGKQHPCTESQPPQSPICETFSQKIGTIPFKELEVVIFDTNEHQYVRCFRDRSLAEGSKGWCWVAADAVNKLGKLKADQSWGFCSRNCYLDREIEPMSAVLREVRNVEVLDDSICNHFLQVALKNKMVKVPPQILCVAQVEQLKYQMYSYEDGKFSKMNTKESKYMHPYLFNKTMKMFLRSAGTCHGDSGGPLYVQKNNKFVVIGAVSGGRGILGQCGGVNNPTHYTRLKLFVPWIQQMILTLSGPEESEPPCII